MSLSVLVESFRSLIIKIPHGVVHLGDEFVESLLGEGADRTAAAARLVFNHEASVLNEECYIEDLHRGDYTTPRLTVSSKN